MSLSDAVELKRKYPIATRGFSIFEVQKIWEDYSETMAATWMRDDNEEQVTQVFNQYKI